MIDTKMTSAAVYRNGCVIKRKAVVSLKAGTQTLCLKGLSHSLDESSLRLSVPEGVSGSNVQIVRPTSEAQQEALRELNEKMIRLESSIKTKQKMAALWENNADFSHKESLSIEEMTDYLEKLPARLGVLSQELQELEAEKKALSRELEEARRKAGLPYVMAELQAAQAGTYPLELSYRDYGASWNPVYEIHSEDDTDSLQLRLRARVAQNTGEDWNNVALCLYTGNPSVSGSIPELASAHLRFYVPAPPMQRNMMLGAMAKAARPMEDTATLDTEAMMMEESAPMASFGGMSPVMAGSGTATKGETMTEYALSGTWDIPKDQDILCDIRTDRIACRYHVVAVPKLSEDSYLAAEVATADLEELGGTPASVYLKGAFAGNVILNPDMTKDTYDLSLGVDESIKVKRLQKKRHTSQVLLKGQKKTEYEYEITVSSRKDKTVEVSILDQIQVSDEKSIVVEAQELSGGVRDEETGLVRWVFPLAAGESKALTLAWSTAWPKDKQTQEVPVRV